MKTSNALVAAALAGLIAAGTTPIKAAQIFGGSTVSETDKDKCNGKEEKAAANVSNEAEKDKEKEKCNGKEEKAAANVSNEAEKDKDKEKDKCDGKDGCPGKDKKKEGTIL